MQSIGARLNDKRYPHRIRDDISKFFKKMKELKEILDQDVLVILVCICNIGIQIYVIEG